MKLINIILFMHKRESRKLPKMYLEKSSIFFLLFYFRKKWKNIENTSVTLQPPLKPSNLYVPGSVALWLISLDFSTLLQVVDDTRIYETK